jgi:hypothetical protein
MRVDTVSGLFWAKAFNSTKFNPNRAMPLSRFQSNLTFKFKPGGSALLPIPVSIGTEEPNR